MLYTGTLPKVDDLGNPTNYVDQGDTGRGLVARARVREGKDAGKLRAPAQAWLWLSRYFAYGMPPGDKTYWKDRAAATTFRTRYGQVKTVTGLSLFFMSNTAALTFDEDPVRMPPLTVDPYQPMLVLDSVEAIGHRLKLYCYFYIEDPIRFFVEFYISAIFPDNIENSDPLRNTTLIGIVKPNEVVPIGGNPTLPQYLSLHFMIKVGQVVGIHVVARHGSQTAPWPWFGETGPVSITKLTAV